MSKHVSEGNAERVRRRHRANMNHPNSRLTDFAYMDANNREPEPKKEKCRAVVAVLFAY